MNWPIARFGYVANILVDCGTEVFPELRRILFTERDEEWHYSIMCLMVSKWSSTLVEQFKAELIDYIDLELGSFDAKLEAFRSLMPILELNEFNSIFKRFSLANTHPISIRELAELKNEYEAKYLKRY